MDLGQQGPVYKGEESPANRVVSGFLTWDGSRGPLGIMVVPENPLQKLEQFHSEPSESEPLALGRGMENAARDCGGYLGSHSSAVTLSL